MLDLDRHRREYTYDLVTVLNGILPNVVCNTLVARIDSIISEKRIQLVDHFGKGTIRELDAGGRYLHHIFKGPDIRLHLPELEAAYHTLVPLVSAVTMQDVIVSPYPDSDINIKAYPSGGGTIGRHLDTNGITALLYLTTNSEGALMLDLERNHPSRDVPDMETRSIYATGGSLLLMQGRKVWHHCEPLVSERKIVAVFNYYVNGDVWRPGHFDSLVYDGVGPQPEFVM